MKVAICTPLHGDPKAEYTKSLVNLCLLTQKQAPALEVRYFQAFRSLVQVARTELVHKAEEWGADYLLFIDADHDFPPISLLRLLSHRLEFVATNYPRRNSPHAPVAVDLNGEMVVSVGRAGLEEIQRVGLGLCLIEMKALRRVEAPYFNVVLLPDGEGQGEDYYFCDRAREAGLKVMVDHDLSLMTSHVGSQAFTHRDTLLGLAQAALKWGVRHESTTVAPAGPE